jgi:hypothetical protein
LKTPKWRGRKVRQVILSATLAVATLIAGYVTVGTAEAQTGAGDTTNVYWNVPNYPGEQTRIQYSTFLASLRQAVSVGSSDRGQQTQSNPPGLIRVSLTAEEGDGTRRGVDLWVTPNDLYVVGFQVRGQNYRWQFSDSRWPNPLPVEAGIDPRMVYNLPFGGNYNSLTQAAGRDRAYMPISYPQVTSAILGLGRSYANGHTLGSDRQSAARCLMLLIQMVSEAARFNDVESQFRSALGGWDESYLTTGQQNLETNWATLSNFFYRLNQGTNPAPVNVSGIGTIRDRAQVRRYVRVLLGSTSGHLPPAPGRDEF